MDFIFILSSLQLPYFYFGIGFLLFVIIILTLVYKKSLDKQSQLRKDVDELEFAASRNKKEQETKIQDDQDRQNANTKSFELKQKIALKKAEDSNFRKNNFLASMSREIRTPLSGIIGLSEMLQTELNGSQKTEMLPMVQNIAESSKSLLILLERIIDLSRLEANDYSSKRSVFNISDSIEKRKNKLSALTLKKGLKLEINLNDSLLADGDQLVFEKAFDLIFENAIKYTLQGKVIIEAKSDENTDLIQVQITDSGIGIDSNFLADIFEAYRQESKGFSRINQGAGLGLPLAHKLMLLTGGTIQIESEKGIGTKVVLTLKKDSSHSVPSNEISIPSINPIDTADNSKKLPFIFIVEDDKMNRLVFNKMLSSYAEIDMAEDGAIALEKMDALIKMKKNVDIFLFDINLPSPWDGMLLLKEFKAKWPILNEIPFVAQTAYAFTGEKERFLAAGFDDYISKPIDRKELFKIIENNILKFEALKN